MQAGSEFEITRSLRHGSVSLHRSLADSTGYFDALGPKVLKRDLILTLIIAQSLKPSSKLAHFNYLSSTTLPSDLNLGNFDADDCYEALDYLLLQQSIIELRLVSAYFQLGH